MFNALKTHIQVFSFVEPVVCLLTNQNENTQSKTPDGKIQDNV